MKAQLQMKLRRISFFVAGLLSSGHGQAQPVQPTCPLRSPASAGGCLRRERRAAEAVSVEAPDKGNSATRWDILFAGLTNDMINKMGLDIKGELDMGQFMEAFSNVVGGSAMTINIEDLKKILRQHDSYHTNQINIMTNKLIATGPENKLRARSSWMTLPRRRALPSCPAGWSIRLLKMARGSNERRRRGGDDVPRDAYGRHRSLESRAHRGADFQSVAAAGHPGSIADDEGRFPLDGLSSLRGGFRRQAGIPMQKRDSW